MSLTKPTQDFYFHGLPEGPQRYFLAVPLLAGILSCVLSPLLPLDEENSTKPNL